MTIKTFPPNRIRHTWLAWQLATGIWGEGKTRKLALADLRQRRRFRPPGKQASGRHFAGGTK